jgi:hypothetical protein
MPTESPQAPIRQILERHESLVVFLGYIALSLVMTYPMIFHLDWMPHTGVSRVAPGSDSLLHIWELWWLKESLFNFQDPFYTNHMFYPFGVSLYFTLLILWYGFLSLPLQFFLELIEIYNLFYLFSLVMSGMGTYFLIRYLYKTRRGAFIGGCIYAFSPFIFVHISHLTIFSAYPWVPFFALFFMKMFKENRYRNPVLASLFFLAVSFSDLNFTVFLTAFMVFFLLWGILWEKQRIFSSAYITQFLLLCLVFLVLVGPYALPLVKSYYNGSFAVSLPLQSAISQSADVLSFLTPSFMHPVFGNLVMPIYDHIGTFQGQKISSPIELVAYTGFSVLLLSVYGLKHGMNMYRSFWLLMTVAFAVLCLGPVLKFHGLVTIPFSGVGIDKLAARIEPGTDPFALALMKDNVGIPLPFLIWHFTPIFGGTESATRMFCMVMLGLSVMSAWGTKSLYERYRDKNLLGLKAGNILVGIILTVVLFEYLSAPIQMMPVPVPDFYKRIQSNPGDFGVIDLPLITPMDPSDPSRRRVETTTYYKFYNIYSALSLYYQTIHGKKVLGGLLGRYPGNLRNYAEETPFLNLLAYPDRINEKTISTPHESLINDRLRYIVLHKAFLNHGQTQCLVSLLDANFSRPFFEDHQTIVYQVY